MNFTPLLPPCAAALLPPLGTMAQGQPETPAVHIRILIGERSLAATLDDSATARGFDR